MLWSPFADGDAPWIYHQIFTLAYEEYVTDVVDAVGTPVFRDVIDNKSMRRIRNQEIQMVVEQTTALVAASVNVSVTGRMLNQE